METRAIPRTEIGVLEKDRLAVSALLNKLLADEFLLYAKTRNFHWNVTGMHFASLHALFEKQYEEVNEIVDQLAERVRALGHVSMGSLREFLDHSRLRELPGAMLPAERMVLALLEDHESLVRALRQDLEICAQRHDAGTSDLLTGLMERHEKAAWMLRSHLGAALP